ncbi:MAG: hypothetical protein ABFS35_19935 [Bacteroidota bacterium]
MKLILLTIGMMLMALNMKGQEGFIINHLNTDLSQIPENWIDSAKQKLKIKYFRRSHGSHIDVGGMAALRRFSTEYSNLYNYSKSPADGSLLFDYQWYSLDFENEVWDSITRVYLDAPENAEINVIMWAWSSYLYLVDVDKYLQDMEVLISEYGPEGTKIRNGDRSTPVIFIFQTACGQRSIDRNEPVYINNQKIREHCLNYNRILYDFNDLECYDPDGNYYGDGMLDGSYTDIRLLNDDLAYYSDSTDVSVWDGGGNWGIEWMGRNSESELALLAADDICTVCEHSDQRESDDQDNSRLHCVLKGRAAWWLWAKLAGWHDDSLYVHLDNTLCEDNLNTSPITFTLVGESFADELIEISNIQLNNAPTGLSIESINYVNEKNIEIILEFDGTDFDEDYSDFSFTINASELLGENNLTSNKLIIKAIDENYIYWTGEEDNDWNNVSNWKPSVLPLSTDSVYIRKELINYPQDNSGYDIDIAKMIVEEGAYIVIPTETNLRIRSNLTLKSSSLGDGNLVDNGNLSVDGYTVVERYLKGKQFHYVSSPLTECSHTIYSELPQGGDNPNFYAFDEEDNSDDWLYSWSNSIAVSGNLVPGRGYANYLVQDNVSKLTGGALNTGDINIDVSNSDYGIESDGWNLVGNPYPSGIEADKFIDANSSVINGTLYFWDDDNSDGEDYDTDDYACWNLAGAIGTGGGATSGDGFNVPNGIIASGQAFFVNKPEQGTDALVFKNDMRTFGSTSFFKKNDQNSSIRFSLTSDSLKLYNEILLAFVNGGTDDFDNLYDAVKLKGNKSIAFFSLLNKQELAIQSFGQANSYNIFEKIISIGFTVSKSSNYTISFIQKENIPKNTKIYLEDVKLNKIVDLNKANYYRFFSDSGIFNDRIKIFVNKKPKKGAINNEYTESSIKIYTHSNFLYLNLDTEDLGGEIRIIDISGYEIDHFEINQTNYIIPVNKITGPIIVNLKSKVHNISKSVIINN